MNILSDTLTPAATDTARPRDRAAGCVKQTSRRKAIHLKQYAQADEGTGCGEVVILDNLGSHKGKSARNAIRAKGADLLFLPPYRLGLRQATI